MNNKFKRKIKSVEKFEFNQIDKYIYIGTTISNKNNYQKIFKLGVRADIDLQEEKEDRPYALEAFLWLPTIDFNSPTQIQLKIGVQFIHELVINKMKCYIHCRQGHGRAPTLLAAYYIFANKMNPLDAIAKIRKNRPQAEPNLIQISALNKFYNQLKLK